MACLEVLTGHGVSQALEQIIDARELFLSDVSTEMNRRGVAMETGRARNCSSCYGT